MHTSISPTAPAWTSVQYRHLAGLAAIAQTGSFRGAARELGYSQSALSQHIAQLERLVAVRVVERRSGSADVELTPAGRLLLGHFEPILGSYRTAEADLAELTAGGGRRLRLSVAEHLARAVLPATLPALARRHRSASIDITHAAAERCAATLIGGTADVVIGDPPDRAGQLEVRSLAPEPYVLIAPAAWGVVRRPDVTAADLLEHVPLVRAEADSTESAIRRELRAGGLTLRGATTVVPAASVLTRVAEGAGAALVSASAAAGDDARIVALSLDGLVAPRPVTVAWRRCRRVPELVLDFVELVCAARPLAGSAVAAAA